jgi:hypothetical protein
VVVVGGTISAAQLTLILLPVTYYYAGSASLRGAVDAPLRIGN